MILFSKIIVAVAPKL